MICITLLLIVMRGLDPRIQASFESCIDGLGLDGRVFARP